MSGMIIKSVSDFVDTCLQLYPPFRNWDSEEEKTWSAIMTRELDGFSPAVLDRAFTDLVRSRKGTSSKDRSTPSPGECVTFCLEAERWLERIANQGKLPAFRDEEESKNPWTKERRKLAYDLIKCGMGRQAASDNPCWILQLWDYCRNHKELPRAQHQIDALKREAGEFEEAYKRVLFTPEMPNAVALKGLAEGMLAKRRSLCAEVLGQ